MRCGRRPQYSPCKPDIFCKGIFLPLPRVRKTLQHCRCCYYKGRCKGVGRSRVCKYCSPTSAMLRRVRVGLTTVVCINRALNITALMMPLEIKSVMSTPAFREQEPLCVHSDLESNQRVGEALKRTQMFGCTTAITSCIARSRSTV